MANGEKTQRWIAIVMLLWPVLRLAASHFGIPLPDIAPEYAVNSVAAVSATGGGGALLYQARKRRKYNV